MSTHKAVYQRPAKARTLQASRREPSETQSMANDVALGCFNFILSHLKVHSPKSHAYRYVYETFQLWKSLVDGFPTTRFQASPDGPVLSYTSANAIGQMEMMVYIQDEFKKQGLTWGSPAGGTKGKGGSV